MNPSVFLSDPDLPAIHQDYLIKCYSGNAPVIQAAYAAARAARFEHGQNGAT